MKVEEFNKFSNGIFIVIKLCEIFKGHSINNYRFFKRSQFSSMRENIQLEEAGDKKRLRDTYPEGQNLEGTPFEGRCF